MIETKQLILRDFCQEDFPSYAQILEKPEIMQFIGGGEPLSKELAWRNLAMLLGHWQLRGFGMWAVEHKESGALIGRVGFFEPEDWPGFELGWLIDKPYWRKGLATEAAKAALKHAFQVLGKPKVISLIAKNNTRSENVAKRIGMKLEKSILFHGIDIKLYAKKQTD